MRVLKKATDERATRATAANSRSSRRYEFISTGYPEGSGAVA
jgi:hypothetical protein